MPPSPSGNPHADQSPTTHPQTSPSNGAPPPEVLTYLPTLWEGPSQCPPVPPGELHLSCLAFLKLLRWRSRSSNEVAAFGLSHADNPLFITDLILPYQHVSGAFCNPHEDYLAVLMERLTFEPYRWLTAWFHTHPDGMGPSPSGTDVSTFNSTRFSQSDHSSMIILGGNNEWSCRFRLRFRHPHFAPLISQLKVVPHLHMLPSTAPNWSQWDQEYDMMVHPMSSLRSLGPAPTSSYESYDWRESSQSKKVRPPHSSSFGEIVTLAYNLGASSFFDLLPSQCDLVASALLDPDLFDDALVVIASTMELDRRTIAYHFQQRILHVTAPTIPRQFAWDDIAPYINKLNLHPAAPSLAISDYLDHILQLVVLPSLLNQISDSIQFPPELAPRTPSTPDPDPSDDDPSNDISPEELLEAGFSPEEIRLLRERDMRPSPQVVDFTASTPRATNLLNPNSPQE